jgi:hypothetical protein
MLFVMVVWSRRSTRLVISAGGGFVFSGVFLQELRGGGGVHHVGPDLLFRGDGAFGHGVVGHLGVGLAAGDDAEDGRDQAAGN